mmetsp:Transcript_83957/g.242761  ORF Transcript_83957/g.242761 Transcript_83957/m.242761 type:complete len:450 (-) Transcript_83957:197-1546(-)
MRGGWRTPDKLQQPKQNGEKCSSTTPSSTAIYRNNQVVVQAITTLIYSRITDKAVLPADLPQRPIRPRHAVLTQPDLSCATSARKAPLAAVCTAGTKACLSIAFSTALELPTDSVVDAAMIFFANSLISQQPASWTLESVRCASIAFNAALTTPCPVSTRCIWGLCTQRQNIAQTPACCTSGESGCSPMADKTTSTPPRLSKLSWYSAFVAVKFRSTPQPTAWMCFDEPEFSMARRTIWMPPFSTISSWFAALYAANSRKARRPNSTTIITSLFTETARNAAWMPPSWATVACTFALHAAALRINLQPNSCTTTSLGNAFIPASAMRRPFDSKSSSTLFSCPLHNRSKAHMPLRCTRTTSGWATIALTTDAKPPARATSPCMPTAFSSNCWQPRSCAAADANSAAIVATTPSTTAKATAGDTSASEMCARGLVATRAPPTRRPPSVGRR